MSSHSIISFLSKISALCVLAICVAALSSSSTRSLLLPSLEASIGQQNQTKVVKRERLQPNDPIRLTNLKYGSKTLMFGIPFEGSDEWLRDMIFQIRNNSNKDITYLEVTLVFPDTKATGSAMIHRIHFGRNPESSKATGEPLVLRPKGTLNILVGTEYERIKLFIESRQPITTLNTLMIIPNVIFFDDGTMWSPGSYFMPDPANPGRHKKLTPHRDYLQVTEIRL